MKVRGLAEQAESTETKRFKEPTDPLLSAREVSPRTNLPDEEALKRRDGEAPFSHCLRRERQVPERNSRRIDFETLFKGMIGSIQTTYLRATQTK